MFYLIGYLTIVCDKFNFNEFDSKCVEPLYTQIQKIPKSAKFLAQRLLHGVPIMFYTLNHVLLIERVQNKLCFTSKVSKYEKKASKHFFYIHNLIHGNIDSPYLLYGSSSQNKNKTCFQPLPRNPFKIIPLKQKWPS